MILLTLVLGQIVGVFNTMGTIIGEVSNEYNYSTADSANLGAAFIVGGVIGCIPFGIVVGKYQNYKSALFVITFMAMLILIIEYFFFPRTIVWLSILVCFF